MSMAYSLFFDRCVTVRCMMELINSHIFRDKRVEICKWKKGEGFARVEFSPLKEHKYTVLQDYKNIFNI